MTTATGGFARCEVALQCILPKRKITSLFMHHCLNDFSRIGYVNNVMNINHGVSWTIVLDLTVMIVNHQAEPLILLVVFIFWFDCVKSLWGLKKRKFMRNSKCQVRTGNYHWICSLHLKVHVQDSLCFTRVRSQKDFVQCNQQQHRKLQLTILRTENRKRLKNIMNCKDGGLPKTLVTAN